MTRRGALLVVVAAAVIGLGVLVSAGSSETATDERPAVRFVDRGRQLLAGEVAILCAESRQRLRPRDIGFEARQGLASDVIPPGKTATVEGRRVTVTSDPTADARNRWCVVYTASNAPDDDLSFVWRDEVIATMRILNVEGADQATAKS